MIKCHRNALLKTYIDMNADLRKKMILKKPFFSKMNAFFGKIMENVGENRDIKIDTTRKRGNYLVSEPNYHTKKFFT